MKKWLYLKYNPQWFYSQAEEQGEAGNVEVSLGPEHSHLNLHLSIQMGTMGMLVIVLEKWYLNNNFDLENLGNISDFYLFVSILSHLANGIWNKNKVMIEAQDLKTKSAKLISASKDEETYKG